MAAAAENQRLAENKRRNEMAARIRTDLKEEFDVARAKHKIQSGIIRWTVSPMLLALPYKKTILVAFQSLSAGIIHKLSIL